MALTIDSLEMRGFRNHPHLVLDGLGAFNVISGPNASGKTNIIEAIELICAGRSHRRPAWSEVVTWGSEAARVGAVFVDESRRVEQVLRIEGGERTYEVNGKRKAASAVCETCPCVLFTPDDLLLVKDSSSRRRGALDDFGSMLSKSFSVMCGEYRQVLRQRNLLVRDENADSTLIGAYNAGLVSHGSALCVSRWRLVERLAGYFSRIHAEISGGQTAEMVYVPSWERFDEGGNQVPSPREAGEIGGGGVGLAGGMGGEEGEAEDGDAGAGESGAGDVGDAGGAGRCGGRRPCTLEEAAGELWMLLERTSVAERARHASLAGPHKDELVFFVDGKNARLFASQGQQRTVVLAFKLAQVEVAAEMRGQPPVLLLDDVMGELDEEHRGALAHFAPHAAQTFLTTANPDGIDEELIAGAHRIEL